jgi:hypothetical protein
MEAGERKTAEGFFLLRFPHVCPEPVLAINHVCPEPVLAIHRGSHVKTQTKLGLI